MFPLVRRCRQEPGRIGADVIIGSSSESRVTMALVIGKRGESHENGGS